MLKLIMATALILGLGLSMAPKTTSEFPPTPSYTCTQCWQHCELVQDSPILWHCPCCNVRYAIQGSNW
jgi:DNA-directed RNA polymerase subunit RPC12/RpoP